MENPPFQDVFPIEHANCPPCHVSFRECIFSVAWNLWRFQHHFVWEQPRGTVPEHTATPCPRVVDDYRTGCCLSFLQVFFPFFHNLWVNESCIAWCIYPPKRINISPPNCRRFSVDHFSVHFPWVRWDICYPYFVLEGLCIHWFQEISNRTHWTDP